MISFGRKGDTELNRYKDIQKYIDTTEVDFFLSKNYICRRNNCPYS